MLNLNAMSFLIAISLHLYEEGKQENIQLSWREMCEFGIT